MPSLISIATWLQPIWQRLILGDDRLCSLSLATDIGVLSCIFKNQLWDIVAEVHSPKLRCNRKWMNTRYLDILFGNHHFHIPPCFFGCIVNIGWLIDWLPWRSKIGQSWTPQGTLYDLPDCLKPNSPASIVAMFQCMRSILYMICTMICIERGRERERERERES